jgi:HD-GYP domain-containing protein (c-di-GMP phosphodiesterase class II)
MIIDTAMSLLRANSGAFCLMDRRTQTLRIRVSRGLEQARTRKIEFKPGLGIEGQVLSDGKEKMITDLALHPNQARLHPESKSKMCAPLFLGDETVGVITLEAAQYDTFNQTDLDLFAALASQGSEVLQNIATYEEIRNKANRLGLLYDIGKQISTIYSLPELFGAIIQKTAQVLKAKRAFFFILEEDQKKLELRAAVGANADMPSIPRDRGVMGHICGMQKSLLIASLASEPFYDPATDEWFARGPLLMSPLVIRGKLYGVLCLNGHRLNAEFTDEDLALLEALASQAAIAIENVELYASIRRDYLNAIKALAAAVDAKDHYTHGHSNKVMNYAEMIAKEMKMPIDEIEKIKYGALLHDVGKIGISESVLNKATALSSTEFDTIAMHPILGVSIVQNIESLRDLVPSILYHHERFNGGGYPEGRGGQAIPLGARIIAVADSWDVMTSDRAYRKALPLDVAIAELEKCSGTQFDPQIVAAFLRVVRRKHSDAIKEKPRTRKNSGRKSGPLHPDL